jgi:hypothetical protein
MGVIKKANGCVFGLFLGSVFRIIIQIIELLGRIIGGLLLFLGLWIPALYALLGAVLYWTLGFNPLDFSTAESMLYLVGFIACCICSAVIIVRNLVVRPAKSFAEGFKYPIWRKRKPEGCPYAAEQLPYKKKKQRDLEPQKTEYDSPKPTIREDREAPKVYFSEYEDGKLIHEYEDRFEVHAADGDGQFKRERTEYK